MASQAAGKNLGYVLVDGTEGTFRGAVLVTDFRGIPADFRYTDPITPSKIEKILYGNALDVYIKEELILESLVGAVEVPPALWICKDGELLDPLAKLAKSKTILLAPTARSPLDATGDIEKQNDPGTYIVQADAVSAPLRFTLPGGRVREEDARSAASILVEAAATMDLLEPFSRMGKAMTALGEEKSGS
ncbi:hypothetical protein [Aminivibrio sp.]|uniref:hypothetical protein n=1 Tax=Aminivibrio sp. TaxID=1872489 RepID=UPI001A3FA3D0|nr:hypothetical protein [Aminivibrio sp.]MBL3538874.1 hypothetical protein [Aminivibrio sp.]